MDRNANDTTPSTTNRQYIAHNNCYVLAFDEAKNRVYYTILGFWKNEESIPAFLADWDNILQLVSPGFDLVVDMRTMITHPQQLNNLHEEALQKVRTAQVGRVANVMPHDKIASLQADELIKRAELSTRNFENCETADKWLDGLMA